MAQQPVTTGTNDAQEPNETQDITQLVSDAIRSCVNAKGLSEQDIQAITDAVVKAVNGEETSEPNTDTTNNQADELQQSLTEQPSLLDKYK